MNTDNAPLGGPSAAGGDIGPPPWALGTARHTSTPYAAYSAADPRCVQFACRYYATTAERDRYIAKARTSDPSQMIYQWDLDRSNGRWTATVEPDAGTAAAD